MTVARSPLTALQSQIYQKPYFWIANRGGTPQTGVHVAFAVASRELVVAFHAAALEAGATDNGGPGERPI